MNINRNNYEEYFILYMDNELNSEDRRQIESFIDLHPDLKEELQLLQQYKLSPDTSITFKGKEDLFFSSTIEENQHEFINAGNYEEYLLQYVDNELTTEQRLSVEQFIVANPLFKKELDLLQRTKLQPEEIVFADKASLYKKEEPARIISIRWWRIAAAAILLLGISFGAYTFFNKKSTAGTTEGIVNTQKDEIKNPVILPEKENTIENSLLAKKAGDEQTSAGQVTSNDKALNQSPVITAGNNNRLPDNKKIVSPMQVKKEDVIIAEIKKPNNNLPIPDENPIIKSALQKDIIASNEKKEDVNTITTAKVTVTNNNTSPSNIKQAVFTDETVFTEPEGKKNKFRGFFRKITRTFEKKASLDADDDDDKLLVAGLAFKLK